MSKIARLALFLPSLTGGGAERVVVNMAIAFCERGIDVDLVLLQPEHLDGLRERADVLGRSLDFGVVEGVERDDRNAAHDQADDREHDENLDQRHASRAASGEGSNERVLVILGALRGRGIEGGLDAQLQRGVLGFGDDLNVLHGDCATRGLKTRYGRGPAHWPPIWFI